MLIYGSMLCPDCVECCKALDAVGTPYTFCEFSENLAHLKAFLKLRDSHAVFETAKAEGKIGIPCFVHEDGTVTLTW